VLKYLDGIEEEQEGKDLQYQMQHRASRKRTRSSQYFKQGQNQLPQIFEEEFDSKHNEENKFNP